MVKLSSVDNPRLAQAFIDYMATRGITIEMMPEGQGSVALWLTDDQFEAESVRAIEAFLADPYASKYQAASWDLAESRTRKFHYDTPSLLAMLKAKAGPVTLLVMIASAVIFALLMLGFSNLIFGSLHFPAAAGQQWQLWRWFSHVLLHFSVVHIAFNLMWWWQLGGDVEKRLGSLKLVQLFFAAALLSGAGQYWVEGANFGGLSGVVYALLGYVWLLGVRAPQLTLSLPKPIMVFMLVWLVLGYVQPYMAIANTAHLVGLVTGLAFGWLDSQRLGSMSSHQ